MPRFNLADYETVEERIKRFYKENPDGRIITQNLTTVADRSVSTWIVRAEVFLTASDQAVALPKASGLAFEVDGGNGANQTSALENAETSAIGRALANAGYSGNKRASREEMEKVVRSNDRDWVSQADRIADVAGLRWLYAQAKGAGASADELERIEARAKALSPSSQSDGTDGGLSGGQAQGQNK